MKEKFLRFEGYSFLNSRGVAVYEKENEVKLQEENEHGRRFGKPVHVAPHKYLELREEWSAGCLGVQDAAITARALDYVRMHGA